MAYKHTLLSIFMGFLLAFSSFVTAEENKNITTSSSVNEVVEPTVQKEAENEIVDRREAIMKEAVHALAETKTALQALEEKKIDEALDALAVTVGKLELIVARKPELALAPTDVYVVTKDLLANPKTIKFAIDEAKEAIEDGNIQTARRLLENLASEIVITVTNLPLATYPDAIKAVTPLIDDGKIEEAKRGLQTALNTLVLTKHVVPLPVLRAKELLTHAEELSEKVGRAEEESKKLSKHLLSAREQLKMAEMLGYGDKHDYKALYTQLDLIEEKTKDGKSGSGFFDKIKSSLSKLWESVLS